MIMIMNLSWTFKSALKLNHCLILTHSQPYQGTNSNPERVECTSLQETISTGRNVKDDFDARVEESTRVEQPKEDWEVSCETRLSVLEVGLLFFINLC